MKSHVDSFSITCASASMVNMAIPPRPAIGLVSSPHYSWCESPMSKSLRSRPIDLCLEENGDRSDRSDRRAEMAHIAKRHRVGATAYSCVRSLRDLLIGQTLCIAFPRTVNNAG